MKPLPKLLTTSQGFTYSTIQWPRPNKTSKRISPKFCIICIEKIKSLGSEKGNCWIYETLMEPNIFILLKLCWFQRKCSRRYHMQGDCHLGSGIKQHNIDTNWNVSPWHVLLQWWLKVYNHYKIIQSDVILKILLFKLLSYLDHFCIKYAWSVLATRLLWNKGMKIFVMLTNGDTKASAI